MVQPIGDIKGIPPVAGIRQNKNEMDTAKGCLTQNVVRSQTPPHVRKWRKSMFSEPGQRVLHPGQIEDLKKLAGSRIYGVSSKGCTHIEPVQWIKDGRASGRPSEAPDMRQAIKESLYLTAKREKLGKPVERGHVLPQTTKEPGFRFGVSSNHSESVKDLLYPHVTEDGRAFKPQYIRSHQSYEPGEQRRRDYTWSIDPSKHRFGVRGGTLPYNGVSTSVAAILHGEPEEVKRTIAKVSQVNYQATQDRLGKVKAIGMTSEEVPGAHVFGRPSMRRGQADWDAKACIQGGYVWEDQEPDADLGKSITPGFRNVTADTRAFGVPSIRTDIPRYNRRSLADAQNYGDEKSAAFLLNPSQFGGQGVEDEELEKPRDKDELQSLFKSLGYELTEDEFEMVFRRAAKEVEEGQNPKVSIHRFRNVLNEMLTAKEYDSLDQWVAEESK